MQAWLFLACASIAFLSAGCSSGSSGDPRGTGTTPQSPLSSPTVEEPKVPWDQKGPPCASDADCRGGTVCFYEQPSCDPAIKAGHCEEPKWSHECAVNIPRCGCNDQTLHGNNCGDVIRERWKASGECHCKTDSDCQGGQRCFFRFRGCDAGGRCEDPARPMCSQHTQTICTCTGKTQPNTCVGEMREPWSETAPCPAPRK